MRCRVITFRIPPGLYAKLRHAVAISGISQSEIIRRALDYYLKKHKYLDEKVNIRRVRL